MLELHIHSPTVVKVRPENSALLQAGEKSSIEANTVFPIAAWTEIAGHFKVTLGKVNGKQMMLLNRNTVYVWLGHAEIFKAGERIAKPNILPVPFFKQTDNYVEPHRTCNSSSHAMIVSYFHPSKLTNDDGYLQQVKLLGDTTDHRVHTQLLQQYGIRSEWRQDLDFDDLDQQIAKGFPIAIGILHRGPLSHPTGGHICVVRGRTGNGSYIVNDPFGDCRDGYCSAPEKGKGVIYSRALLDARWLVYQQNNGWGRIIHSVR